MRRATALWTTTLICAALAPAALADGGSRAQGIDVYEDNGKLDWAKLRSNGVSFGIARVSDGAHHLDSRFATNWSAMKAAGVVRGAYQFLRPDQDATEQAHVFLSKVTFEPGDLPPFLDVEVRDGMSASHIIKAITNWVSVVKASTGLTPMIYVSHGFWDELDGKTAPDGAGLWVANWDTSKPTLPHGWTDWTIWQYAETAKLAPGSGADADVFNGTVSELKDYAASQSPTYKEGAHGEAVTTLQKDLAKHGFNPGSADGDFGSATREQVEAFQAASGLPVTGVVDGKTFAALAAAPAPAASPTKTTGFVGAIRGE